jgi:cell filamentation protein
VLKTTEQKKKYIQETRLQNYLASLKLEGITATGNIAQLNKAQILQKYKKYAQAES